VDQVPVHFAVDPRACRQGENLVQLRLATRPNESGAGPVAVEKLELHVQYAEPR
jgi:hypothetical protein